jgi:hypothetical protein
MPDDGVPDNNRTETNAVNAELAILELIAIGLGHAWSLLQWWASISFGLIALTHFGAARLTWLLVAILVTLYTLFTVFWFLNTLGVVSEVLGHVLDLQSLDVEPALSKAAQAKVAFFFEGWTGVGSFVIMNLCVLGTYVGTTAYLIHTFVKGRAKQAK